MTYVRIAAVLFTLLAFGPAFSQSTPASKPNIVFVLMDNLGYGEVGVYGGGVVRGAPTPRIDRLAALLRAKAAGGVELLERQAHRIGDLVTAGTHRFGAVRSEALPRRLEVRVVEILHDAEIDIAGRRRHFLAQQLLAHGLAAQRRRRRAGVRVQR